MNALVLPILIPLLAAPSIALVGGRIAAWLIALLAMTGGLAATLYCFSLGDGSSALGGWQGPLGISLELDGANRPILLLIMSAALISLLCLPPKALPQLGPPRTALFYALFCLCVCGLAGIAATGDAFNVFVFLEISSLSTYALVAAGPRRGALRAAFQYLMLGTLGGSFVLLGVGLLYMATGSLNMADIAARLAGSPLPQAVLAGAAFLLLGFALKSALFPLHQWLPGVYAEAPGAVSAFLAASGTKVSIYALTRFGFGVLGAGWLGAHHVDALLMILACAGMLFGSLAAIQQQRLSLLLAWSSVAQVGYIVLGLALLSPAGVTAAWLYLMIHAIAKGGLFIACAALVDDRIESLRGLGRRDPLTAVCLSLGAASLLGVPLTAGFVGKWILIQAAWADGAILGIVALAISSLLAVLYTGRIVLPIWQAPTQEQAPALPAAHLRLPMLLVAAASLLFGLWPQPLLQLSLGAAQALFAP